LACISKKEEKSIRGDNGDRHRWSCGTFLSKQSSPIGRRYRPPLARFRRIALRFLGNIADAEDAVQDALLSAFTHLDQFGGQAKMSTWLTAIVINAAA
jgi:DNA-directed RNA polymerase specialized sigma24 family protein